MTAILFDFDGTIMDTEPAIMASYQYLFRKYRKEEDFTEEIQTMVLGPALDKTMPILFPDQDPVKMVNEYRAYQKEHARVFMKPMKHACSVLETLKASGYPLGIITTRYRKSAMEILQEQNMDAYFDLVIGHEDVNNDKPDPEGILRACSILNEKTCVYVGDSATDVEAGRRAGAYTIALVSNERKRKQLLDERPDAVMEDLEDVIPLVERNRYE